jgi:iron complex outermembrane receptor protein
MKHPLVTGTCIALIGAAAFGTENYEALKSVTALDTIVVEAPKLTTKVSEATAAVEVYTDSEIAATKVNSLSEFLNTYTSVSVQSGFGNMFAPKIEMRGFGLDNGNQNVVVVIDGRRLNAIDSAPQFLAAIPVQSVAKIEILKGSGSVEYGDNATSGVISITTKPFEGVTLQGYAGSYGTEAGSVGAGYAAEALSLSFYGDRYLQDGVRTVDSFGGKDRQELTNGKFDLSYALTDTLELHANALRSDGSIYYAPAQTMAEFAVDPRLLGTAGSGNHSYQAIDDRVYGVGASWEFDGGLLRIDLFDENKEVGYRAITSGSVVSFEMMTAYESRSVDASAEYTLGNWRLLGGFQTFGGQRHTTSAFSEDVARKRSNGFFVKADGRWERHGVSLGARYETAHYHYTDASVDLDDTEDAYALDVGYNYRISDRASLFANINRAFVMPDTDKFFTFDMGTFTYAFNGFIEPMRTLTYNVGYLRNDTANSFKATLFYVDGKNEIYYDPNVGFFGTNTNYDKTRKIGFELYDKYRVHEDLYLQANYTYADATIESAPYAGNTMPATSRHSLVAVAGYTPVDNVLMSLSHTFRSWAYAFEDLENDNLQKQKAYHSTDLTLSYLWGWGECYLKVSNLFDHANMMLIDDDQVHPVDAKRTWLAGARISF